MLLLAFVNETGFDPSVTFPPIELPELVPSRISVLAVPVEVLAPPVIVTLVPTGLIVAGPAPVPPLKMIEENEATGVPVLILGPAVTFRIAPLTAPKYNAPSVSVKAAPGVARSRIRLPVRLLPTEKL